MNSCDARNHAVQLQKIVAARVEEVPQTVSTQNHDTQSWQNLQNRARWRRRMQITGWWQPLKGAMTADSITASRLSNVARSGVCLYAPSSARHLKSPYAHRAQTQFSHDPQWRSHDRKFVCNGTPDKVKKFLTGILDTYFSWEKKQTYIDA